MKQNINIHNNRIKSADFISLEEMVCMKASAINQRGSKKDFFDLYQIINQISLDEKELYRILMQKYNDRNMIISLIYSLKYFEDAEKEELPKVLVEYNWEIIKKFFINYSNKLFKLMQN